MKYGGQNDGKISWAFRSRACY